MQLYDSAKFYHPVWGDYSLYTWCGTCQRVQFTAKWVDKAWRCPHDECAADTRDAWRWEEIRSIESDFPRHPIPGRVYQLYAFEGEIGVEGESEEALLPRSGSLGTRLGYGI